MANLKKRRGRMRYALALYIWGLLLLAGAIYGLMQVWEYAEAFDFDGADSIVSTLKDCELPGEYKEVFEEIKTLVSDVNQIGLMEKIEEMGLN